MNYRDWKAWVSTLPWTMKWFVLLVLIRPLIDILYFLKEVSPLVSPLYIVGVLTPVMIVLCLLSPKMPRTTRTFLDVVINIWGAVLAINCILMLTLELSLESLQLIVKQLTPFFLILYLRRFIQSKRDLVGLLTTFLYSTAFPFAMQLYERFIGPVGQAIQTRGHERFEGLFADVVSYAIYITGALLIACYFFLQERSGKSFRSRAFLLGSVGMLTVMGLVIMHHTASWMVAAMLVGLLSFYSMRKRQFGTIVFVIVLLVIGYVGFGDSVSERLGSALQTDIAVLEGEKDIDRAFHGRVWRWKMLTAYWMEKPLLDKMIGLSVSSMSIEYWMLGSGIHNDFMRIICVTGIIGFLFYVLFYLVLLQSSTQMKMEDQFLIQGGILIMLMYSVTTTPTLYSPLLYLIFSIFAFGALPKSKRKSPLSMKVRPSRAKKIDSVIHV
ncbi:MAG: hypothetical protein KTR29_07480 [Rhodothermaceae bacterium]|nr:hypothetical protein [Rhodothermaceae bacterium]